jgi:hypothetical protein
VGYCPQRDGPVQLDANGKATLPFRNIKLPRRTGVEEVEFSAYAFNEDRVKSETHRVRYELPKLNVRQGAAYVICVGVNAFARPSWNLKFAVADAELMAQVVSDRLQKNKQLSRVVTVTLLSAAEHRDGKRIFTKNTATKENLRRVFGALAGDSVDRELIREIPAAAELKQARPEDLVLISFSTHGHNTDDGRFHLFPADIGTSNVKGVDRSLLDRAVSMDELSYWLRDVDAGEMVMIVDACQSAATVEQEGFKPGPMGSRGLGQLAYNKRMRILAASQAADVALEDPTIRHGLLTYALTRDGLQKGRADFQPRDERILLGEWLRFAVQRVPQLADEIAAGKIRASSVIGRNLKAPDDEAKGLVLLGARSKRVTQQPSLFDFSKGRSDLVLSGLER